MQIDKKIKVGVLCNSDIAIPALLELFQEEVLEAIGLPESLYNTLFSIKAFAKQHHIPLTYFNKGDFAAQSIKWIKNSQIDHVWVMTFPFKIPLEVLDIPFVQFYNFHYGLLPEYRSAEPIFWQIRNKEKYGGITIHKIDAGLDSGPILLKKKIPINANTTHGKHWSDLSQLGAALVPSLLEMLSDGRFSLLPQINGFYLGKPSYVDVKIEWSKLSSSHVVALVKACNPWNKGAYAFLNNNEIRIVDAKLNSFTDKSLLQPGRIVIENNSILIQCADSNFIEPTIYYTAEGFFNAEYLLNLGVNTYSIFN